MVLDLLLIGLAVTLDPLPLSAFLVVPPSKRGAGKARPSYWVAGVPDHRGHGHPMSASCK
jgi:hypothetical protein